MTHLVQGLNTVHLKGVSASKDSEFDPHTVQSFCSRIYKNKQVDSKTRESNPFSLRCVNYLLTKAVVGKSHKGQLLIYIISDLLSAQYGLLVLHRLLKSNPFMLLLFAERLFENANRSEQSL